MIQVQIKAGSRWGPVSCFFCHRNHPKTYTHRPNLNRMFMWLNKVIRDGKKKGYGEST